MTEEEKSKKKPIKLASKIGLDDLMPLIDKIRDSTDLYEKNKTLYEIIKKIPSDFLVLKDAIKEIICNEKDKLIGKTEFNKIWKKTHPTKKTPTRVKAHKDRIKFNRCEIEIKDDGIYSVTLTWNGEKWIEDKEIILPDKFELMRKTSDKKNTLYTFKYNSVIYNTFSKKLLLEKLEPFYYEGRRGRDIIKRVIEIKDKSLKSRKPKDIIGFDNGWILPQTEDEKDIIIVLYTRDQRETYEKFREIIKEYGEKEKESIFKDLRELIDRTQVNKVKKAIILSWSVASLFRMPILDKFGIFPGLALTGAKNTGKTYIALFFISRFYGVWKTYFSNKTIESPARLEDILTTCVIPIQIDELEYLKREIISILKETLSGSSDWRRKLSALEGVSKPKVAPYSITTNKMPKAFQEDALISKLIILNFTDDEKIKDDDRWLEIYNKIKNVKFFSFIYDYTKDWKNKYVNNILTEIGKKLTIKDIDDNPRLKKKLIIIKFGAYLWKKIFDYDLLKGISDKKLLNLLRESDSVTTRTLLESFIYYCKQAKLYSPIKKNPYYLSVELKASSTSKKHRGHYKFTPGHLYDFKKFYEGRWEMGDLYNLLKTSLSKEEQELIKYDYLWDGGKTVKGIWINKDLITGDEDDEEDDDEDKYTSYDSDIEVPGISPDVLEEIERD